MKKWLNIKPKVNDFSEDEVDTETESEDDGIYTMQMILLYLYTCFLIFSVFDSYNSVTVCSPKQPRMQISDDSPFRTQGTQSIFSSQISGKDSILFIR